MAEYNFGSIMNRDFILELKRMAEDVNVQGKTIQDLVADGQLTEEQYANLINTVNGMLKSGEVGEYDLTPELRAEVGKVRKKIDKGEVSIYDINKNKGKFDATYFTNQFLEDLSNAEINATKILPESVGNSELMSKAVSANKTDFIHVSSNLLNANKLEDGFAIRESNGDITVDSSNSVGDFIPIKNDPNFKISVKNLKQIGRYDAEKNFINVYYPNLDGDVYSSTAVTHYIRPVVPTDVKDAAQINIGETLLPYEPYYNNLDENIEVDEDNLLDGAVSETKTSFIERSSNLFDKNNLQVGRVGNDGSVVNDNAYRVTELIKVPRNTYFSSFGLVSIARHDIDGNFLNIRWANDSTEETWTSAHAEYIRVTVRAENVGVAQFNLGETLDPYEKYGYVLNGVAPKIGEDTTQKTVWQNDRFIVEGTVRGNYTAPKIDAFTNHPSRSEFIGFYDEWVSNHPGYVSKSVLTTDSTGEEIYCYDFKPEPVPDDVADDIRLSTKFPKIILIAGMHGDEKAGIYNLYYAMKQIVENWRGSELLETLRWNAHFIVVPVVNNYGFDNSTGVNENGVNLTRNFPENHELNADQYGDSRYGGPSPLSEIQAQAISNLIKEHKDAVYFGSYHNMWDSERFIWNASSTKLQVQIGKRLVSKMTRKWQKEYDWMPQNEDYYIGYSNNASPIGTESGHAAAQGIEASIFEVSGRLGLISQDTFTSEVLTLGTESFINFLVMVLRENTKYYNSINR